MWACKDVLSSPLSFSSANLQDTICWITCEGCICHSQEREGKELHQLYCNSGAPTWGWNHCVCSVGHGEEERPQFWSCEMGQEKVWQLPAEWGHGWKCSGLGEMEMGFDATFSCAEGSEHLSWSDRKTCTPESEPLMVRPLKWCFKRERYTYV